MTQPFDPATCGAQCDRCPLGPNGPFRRGAASAPPMPADTEAAPGRSAPPRWAAVVTSPTPHDASDGVRFLLSGRDNSLWREALATEGKKRSDFAVIPVVSCVATTGATDEDGQWKRLDAKLRKLNTAREAAGAEPFLHPIEACRPRFLNDIAPYADIIALDKVALSALTGGSTSIVDATGDLIALGPDGRRVADRSLAVRRVVPSVPPSFAQRYPKWRQAFTSAIGKAIRWFEDRLRWTDPDLTLEPTPEELDAWLSVKARYHCYDIETDSILTETAKIRCIAVATPDTRGTTARAIGLTLLGEGDVPVHDAATHAAYLDVFRKHMTEPGRPWMGHNAIRFDNAVLEAQWGFSPGVNLRDSMAAARAANPDFPKRLKLWGRVLTDVEAWETTEKGEDLATGAVSPASRLRYCCYDTVVNCRIFDPLVKVAHDKGMMRPLDERLKPEGWPGNLDFTLWNVDQEAQRRAKRMHERGIFIDEEKRLALVADYEAKVATHEGIVRDIMRSVSVRYDNPNSYDQIRELLYKDWDLPIPAGMDAKDYFTDSGLPGTDDNVMRAYMADACTNETQRTLLYHLRLYRRYKNKVLGTVLYPLDPKRKPAAIYATMPQGHMTRAELADLGYDAESIAAYGMDIIKPDATFVWPDGRVRSSWSAFVTSVGRYSSSKPNCFSGDTEVLTPEGWVRFDEYVPGTPVMEWSDGAGRFAQPTGYIAQDAPETIRISLEQVDLCVTPDHRCLLQHRKTGEQRVFPAHKYPQDWKQFNACRYDGGGDHIDDALLRLIVATQADGTYKHGSHRIGFAFSKQRKIDRLVGLMDAAGVAYNRYAPDKRGVVAFYLPDQPMTKAIRSWLTPDKQFDWRILRLSRENLDAFVDEVFYWDGDSVRRNSYASVDPQNVSVVQTVLALSNRRARAAQYTNNHGCVFWSVGVGSNDYSMTTNRTITASGPARVYCVSVPSSYLMVRRNGCIAITGNCQNIGNKKGAGPLKAIFSARPGCILIGADLSQAHLYIAASHWGIDPVTSVIQSGADVHGDFALKLMGDRYVNADGWGPSGFSPSRKPQGGMAAAMRNMTKTFRYAWIYWASAPTIWAVMRSTEGDPPSGTALAKALGRQPTIADYLKASMPYIGLELSEIARMDRDAHRAEPQWRAAWERQQQFFRRHGYIEEPIFGRRSGDLEGGKPQAVVNYGVLAAESSIMRIVEHRVEALFPDDGFARGLIHQCHDSVAVEVRLPDGYTQDDHRAWTKAVGAARKSGQKPPPLHPVLEEKRRLLEACMSVTVPGWPVSISGEADVGLSLKDV